MFEWIWKHRNTTDTDMIEIMQRMAVAAERQADAVVASHKAAVASSESAKATNEAIRKKAIAELHFINEERKRRDSETFDNE